MNDILKYLVTAHALSLRSNNGFLSSLLDLLTIGRVLLNILSNLVSDRRRGDGLSPLQPARSISEDVIRSILDETLVVRPALCPSNNHGYFYVWTEIIIN